MITILIYPSSLMIFSNKNYDLFDYYNDDGDDIYQDNDIDDIDDDGV